MIRSMPIERPLWYGLTNQSNRLYTATDCGFVGFKFLWNIFASNWCGEYILFVFKLIQLTQYKQAHDKLCGALRIDIWWAFNISKMRITSVAG